MSDLPEPLTSPDCNCQGLPFMPLEIGRLRDSDLVSLSTGDEFKAAVLLWASAWVEIPAASLPDDDRILARKAGYSLAEWKTLRDMALRGWVKCSDGRLYHPVIADLAAEAFSNRVGQSKRARSRWEKVRAAKNVPGTSPAMPRHAETDTAAQDIDAMAMQVKGKVEEEPPLRPPEGPKTVPVRKADVDAIWAVTPQESRRRSSQADLERSLKAAAKRGKPPDEVRAGLVAYFASPEATKDGGAFVKGVHRMVEGERWLPFVESRCDAPARLPDWDADTWRQAVKTFAEERRWGRSIGPPPDTPGCAAPPTVLREFGFAHEAATP